MSRSAALWLTAGLLVAVTAASRPRTPRTPDLDLPALREIHRRLDLAVSGRMPVPTPAPERTLSLPAWVARVASFQ